MSPIMLLYWEGADHNRVDRLLGSERLPALARLMNSGVTGSLTSPLPLEPWSLAASLATGQIAAAHGIIDHWQSDADNENGFRPVASPNLAEPTLWRIVSSAGKSTATVNWPLSYPTSFDQGLVVSEPFFQTRRRSGQLLPPPAHSVEPASVESQIESCRVHADMLPPERLKRLLGNFRGADFHSDRLLATWATQLALLDSTTAVASKLIENRPLPLLSLRFSGLDMLTRALEKAGGPYPALIDTLIEQFDEALGKLLNRLGKDRTVLLLSGHRPMVAVNDSPSPCPSEPRGFLVAAGPRVNSNAGLLGASLLDIVPTVLRLCELSPAADMPGRVLAEVFELPTRLTGIATWSSCRMVVETTPHPGVVLGIAVEAGHPPPESDEALKRKYTLAQATSLAGIGKKHDALKLLEADELVDDAESLRVRIHLMLDLGRGLHGEVETHIRAMMRAGGSRFQHSLLLARLASLRKQPADAIDRLFDCLACAPDNALVHLYLGREQHKLAQHELAREAYDNALAIQPDLQAAHLGLARTLMAEGQIEAALERSLRALEYGFNTASAHQLLGQILERLGRNQEAADAYHASIHLEPQSAQSHQALARLFEPERLNCTRRHNHHQQIAMRLLARQVLADG